MLPMQASVKRVPASQLAKKASQSLPSAGGKSNGIIFFRGVYLAKNTSQSASLLFKKGLALFEQSQTGGAEAPPVSALHSPFPAVRSRNRREAASQSIMASAAST